MAWSGGGPESAAAAVAAYFRRPKAEQRPTTTKTNGAFAEKELGQKKRHLRRDLLKTCKNRFNNLMVWRKRRTLFQVGNTGICLY